MNPFKEASTQLLISSGAAPEDCQAADALRLRARLGALWRRWSMLLLAGGVALIAACAADGSSGLRPGLAPFDHTKAATFTPGQRADFERELFEELPHWFQPTRRYPTWEPDLYLAREQRWQAMADQGFELAHIVLQVVQPGRGKQFDPHPAFKRLEQLAEQGDAGAMCLMPGLRLISADQYRSDEQILQMSRRWMQRGVELGHPQCLSEMGRRMMYGTGGVARDVKRGQAMVFQSIRQGYLNDSGLLALNHEEQGLLNPAHMKASYCWEYWYSKISTDDPDWSIKHFVDFKASAADQPRMRAQLEELKRWTPTVDECIQLSGEQ